MSSNDKAATAESIASSPNIIGTATPDGKRAPPNVLEVQKLINHAAENIMSTEQKINRTEQYIEQVTKEINLVDEIAKTLLLKSSTIDEEIKVKTLNLSASLPLDTKQNLFNALTTKESQLRNEEIQLRNEKSQLNDRLNAIIKSGSVFEQMLNVSPAGNQCASGISYDMQANEIKYVDQIGLVTTEYGQRRARTVEAVSPKGLEEALNWINVKSKVSIQDAIVGLKNLDGAYVRNAFVSGNQHRFEAGDHWGEMACQQLIYAPFSILFMAAAKGLTKFYAADQDVHASLTTQYKTKTNNDYLEGVTSMMPASAATLGERRDAFGMMEIKPDQNWDSDQRIDYDKCVLMTATTAIIVYKCCKDMGMDMGMNMDLLELPFIIAQGSSCSLYVMKMSKDGNPFVCSVRLKENVDSVNVTYSKSPSWTRSAMLVTLAVLLNNFRVFWTDDLQDQYLMLFKTSVPTNSKRKRIFSKHHSQNKHSSRNDGPSKTSGTGKGGESSAKKAASCGGKFVALKYPFLREMRFTEYGGTLTCQEKSPFYFVCHSSQSQTEKLDIFLKVWRVGEVDLESVRKECTMLRRAHDGGVPAAALKSDELIESHCEDGHEYVVMAMENLDGHSISSQLELVNFSLSLIDSVSQLHSIGLVHGDIKPDNVVWDGKAAKLIDFGHAQEISGALHVNGTVGFEAPEILRNEPSSVETDAFSVGRTILTSLDDFHFDKPSRALNELECVGQGLATESKQNRWSLHRARQRLNGTVVCDFQAWQTAKATGVPFEESRFLATQERLPERSPPGKVPRVTQDVGTSLSAAEAHV